MSFLTKSKSSLPDSPARFGSHRNNPDSNKSKENIMSDLQAFRDGLRKELSGKTSASLKALDVSSPTDMRGLYSNQNLNTPNQRGGPYAKEKEGLWSTKGSQSKVDLLQDFSKRGEKGSPLKQYSSAKNPDILGYFSQSKESQRGGQNLKDGGLLGNKSPFGKNESPRRDGRSTIDIKPLDQFRKELEQKSYTGSKASPRSLLNRQKDLKDDISQIFTSRSPITREEYSSASKGIRERPKTGLLEQAYNPRSGRTDLLYTGSKLGSDSSSLLKGSSTDNLKNSRILGTSEYKSAVSLYENSRDEQQKSRRLLGMELKSLNILNKEKGDTKSSYSNLRTELGSRNVNKEEVLISDQLPLQRLHEVQDLFYNVTEKGFDNLSPDYIEELIRLSSVIMQKVKGSSYYNRA